MRPLTLVFLRGMRNLCPETFVLSLAWNLNTLPGGEWGAVGTREKRQATSYSHFNPEVTRAKG